MYTTGDFLIQIKNAYRAGKKELNYPHSNVVESIGKILEKEGYIKNSKMKAQDPKVKSTRKMMILELKYDGRLPAINDIKLISRPSVHHYVGKSTHTRRKGQGILILSTSSGVMTGRDAHVKGVGGELICHIF